MRAQFVFGLAFLVTFTCGNTIPVCKATNAQCILDSANTALPLIFAGDTSRGVESSDPMFIDSVYGDIAGLKYNFSTVTLTGLSKCNVEKINLDAANLKLDTDVVCKWYLSGDYVMTGRLLILPVEGNGKFTIDSKKPLVKLNAELKNAKDKSGKSHLSVKQYSFDVEPLDRIIFSFENLFNGNKELAEAVRKFSNDNYKEVSKEVGLPIYKSIIKKAVKNINKYLKTVETSELITF